MKSEEFMDWKFYRKPMGEGENMWHVYVLVLPRTIPLQGHTPGKYGKDDSVAFLGSWVDFNSNWEETKVSKENKDIVRFTIKKIFGEREQHVTD